ncbi:MAG: Fe-S cluster assembly protein SufD [Bacteroidales bacterium]|nr:Fe-S cluster assembly protein SufD [Bacteroidales bacterium]
MSVKQQYIDLFREQRELIDAHAAPALNAFREQAAEVLEREGLQRPKDFTQVDPEEVLAFDYALNLARYEVPTRKEDLFTCSVPELSTNLHFLVNEQYVEPVSSHPHSSASNYFAGSLRQFATEHPELIEQYYSRLALNQEAQYDIRAEKTNVTAHRPLGEAALNTLLCQDGFVLYVPKGVQVEKPLQLISLLRAVDDQMAVQRLLIIIEDEAKASLLVCDHASDLADVRLLSLQTTEIFVGRNATFDFYALEEHNEKVSRLSTVYVEQQEGSNAAIGQYALQSGTTRNRVYIDLKGEHAETHLFGLAIADGEQKVDNLTYIRHRVPNCQSHEFFKYVADDKARCSFVGRILVQQGADKTDAHQTCRNLCLSTDTRMVARPELEIYADDVKCSHGATTGQLDQQALFYMRTRGIPEAEARMLLMFAFMDDVIDEIRIEPLKDRLRHLVEKRFRGELTQCKSCAIKK